MWCEDGAELSVGELHEDGEREGGSHETAFDPTFPESGILVHTFTYMGGMSICTHDTRAWKHTSHPSHHITSHHITSHHITMSQTRHHIASHHVTSQHPTTHPSLTNQSQQYIHRKRIQRRTHDECLYECTHEYAWEGCHVDERVHDSGKHILRVEGAIFETESGGTDDLRDGGGAYRAVHE